MEDYKKKYEEALERAKCYKGLIAEMGIVFPELKESEDEKMKNFISHELACIRATDEKGSDRYEELTNAIAWLEKQGEQKSADKIQVNEKLYEHIRNTCACIDDALSSKTLVDVNDYLKQASIDAQSAFDMIENLGEQKPVEWSEEDEKYLQDIIQWIYCFIDDEDCGDMTYDEHKEFYMKRINWLKSLRSQPHWKPSKEQMYILEWLTTNVLDDGPVGKKAKAVLSTLIEQLKSL